MDTTTLGKRMENAAADYLCAAGLQVLERNFSCRSGEIDLIARDGETLVFVEVRFRRNDLFGGAGLSVDWRKQKKLQATASRYLQARRLDCPCRFDVVAISARNQHEADAESPQSPNIDWIKNAFGQ